MRGPIFRGIQCDSQKASEPRTEQKDETEINRITGEDPGKKDPLQGNCLLVLFHCLTEVSQRL